MITPLPFGGGDGGGAIIFLTLCVLFLCVLCEKKYVIPYLSLCHSVFKKTSISLSHSVILSSKNICLPLSLCHSVFKKNICLSLSHYVILSENAPVGDGSGHSCCCCYFFSFCLISAFHKQCYVLPHYLSSIYSF